MVCTIGIEGYIQRKAKCENSTSKWAMYLCAHRSAFQNLFLGKYTSLSHLYKKNYNHLPLRETTEESFQVQLKHALS